MSDELDPNNFPGYQGIKPTVTEFNPTFMQKAFGYRDPKTGIDNNGFALPALQGINGLAQSWMGFKQLGLAKDQFNFQKDSFIKQYDQQASSMNTQLEDRQRARLGANPNGYQSVGDYMSNNGVKSYG